MKTEHDRNTIVTDQQKAAALQRHCNIYSFWTSKTMTSQDSTRCASAWGGGATFRLHWTIALPHLFLATDPFLKQSWCD